MQLQAQAISLDMLPKTADLVLDLGTGPGICIPELQARYPNVIGCDLDTNMLNSAKEIAKVVAADAHSLPFKANTFDLIYSNMMLQWARDLTTILKNCFHISKIGGEIIATTLGPQTLKEARQAMASIGRAENINNFIDLHIVGDKLHKAGWQEIFTMTEIVCIEYKCAHDVFKNLKQTSANKKTNSNVCHDFLSPSTWQVCLNNYPKTNGKIIATYEVIAIRAKKLLAANEISIDSITRS